MDRARAMLIQAGLDPKYKEEFWCEVISTATKLDNIMVRPERTKPLHTVLWRGCKVCEKFENIWRNGSGCHL